MLSILILTLVIAALLCWRPIEVGSPGSARKPGLWFTLLLVGVWVLLAAGLVIANASNIKRPLMEVAGPLVRTLMWVSYLLVLALWIPALLFGVPSWGITVVGAAAITDALCRRLWPARRAALMFRGVFLVAAFIPVALVVSIAVHAPIGFIGLGILGCGGIVVGLFIGIMEGGNFPKPELPDDRDPRQIDARLYRHYRGHPPVFDPDDSRSGDLGYRTPYRG